MIQDTRLLIIAPDRPQPGMLEYARLCVTFIWYWHRGTLLLRDNHGVDALAAVQAQQMKTPFQCVGIARRPRNGVPLRYYRQYTCAASGLRDRQDARDRHLIDCADHVLFLDETQSLMTYAQGRGKTLYIVEDGKIHQHISSIG